VTEKVLPPLLFPMPGNEAVARSLASHLGAELGDIETRRFPDGETYLRLRTSPLGRSVALVCTLDRPDPKFLPLMFAAFAAKQLGADRVGLIAPYLAYMRQDKAFQTGEAITSATFGSAISSAFDWLVTIDPHLHRYRSLDAVYSIPSRVGAAAPAIAAWIAATVPRQAIIGPDIESEQWVATVAKLIDAPFQVLRKERLGDREVRISVPDPGDLIGRTPVIVDDIASSAMTMIEAAKQLRQNGLPPPVCVAVHGLFTPEAYAQLSAVAGRVATTNSVLHPSNAIDVSGALASAAAELLNGTARDERHVASA
jgi:ribose-phosphate pyrophosphokinase